MGHPPRRASVVSAISAMQPTGPAFQPKTSRDSVRSVRYLLGWPRAVSTRPYRRRVTTSSAPIDTGPAPVLAGGVDLVDLDRIDALYQTWGERLLVRLCGEQERTALESLPTSLWIGGLALAFGLKESVMKSVKGIPPGGLFTDTDTSGMLPSLDGSGNPIAGPVQVRGATARQLPGEVAQLRCRGGAFVIEERALLTWILIEHSS